MLTRPRRILVHFASRGISRPNESGARLLGMEVVIFRGLCPYRSVGAWDAALIGMGKAPEARGEALYSDPSEAGIGSCWGRGQNDTAFPSVNDDALLELEGEPCAE